MPADAVGELARELRAPVPSSVAALDSEDVAHLAGLIADARHRQAAEIAAAADRSLSFIPRLLRGPLRKVLG